MKKLMLMLGPILFTFTVTMNLGAMDQTRGRRFESGGETATDQNSDRVLGPFARMNLAAEQKARIKALHYAHLTDIKPLQSQVFNASSDLKRLWLHSPPNKVQILAKHKEIMAIREQIRDRRARYRYEVFNALTQVQQEQAKAWRGRPWFEKRHGARYGYDE